jgi:hypothetical protein
VVDILKGSHGCYFSSILKVGLLSSPQDESQGLIYGRRSELGEENEDNIDEVMSTFN